jgi:hypothetical protein
VEQEELVVLELVARILQEVAVEMDGMVVEVAVVE